MSIILWSILMSTNFKPKLNVEKFSTTILHEALENASSTALESKNALVADEYPEAGEIFTKTSSFYRAGLEFCAQVTLLNDKTRKALVDNQQIEHQREDVIPVETLLTLYPLNTELEVSVLWLMIVRNWDEFKMQVERDNLKKVLAEAA